MLVSGTLISDGASFSLWRWCEMHACVALLWVKAELAVLLKMCFSQARQLSQVGSPG